MFHDDLWISFFLATRHVRVKSLSQRLDGLPIYEQVHEVNALKSLEGPLDREAINVREYRDLMARVRMPAGRRFAIRRAEYSHRLRSLLKRLDAKLSRN